MFICLHKKLKTVFTLVAKVCDRSDKVRDCVIVYPMVTALDSANVRTCLVRRYREDAVMPP